MSGTDITASVDEGGRGGPTEGIADDEAMLRVDEGGLVGWQIQDRFESGHVRMAHATGNAGFKGVAARGGRVAMVSTPPARVEVRSGGETASRTERVERRAIADESLIVSHKQRALFGVFAGELGGGLKERLDMYRLRVSGLENLDDDVML